MSYFALLFLSLISQVTLPHDQQVPIELTANGDGLYTSPIFTVDNPSIIEVVAVGGKAFVRAKGVAGTAVVTVNALNRVGKPLADSETFIVAAPPATVITIVPKTPEPIPVEPEPQPEPEPEPEPEPTVGLLQPTNFTYLGAFKVPSGKFGVSSFDYGCGVLAFNKSNNSLFVTSHAWVQAVGEIDIPVPKIGELEVLNTATVRQNFVDIRARLPNNTLEGTLSMGDIEVLDNGELVGAIYEYYDGNGNAIDSHYKLSSQNLETATVTGLFQVGTKGGGWVSSWMCPVPPEWQGRLGTTYLCGNGMIPIISRTSWGTAAFGFNMTDIGPTAAPVIPFVYYTSASPLGPFTAKNDVCNASTSITGIVWPEGTDTILFFGKHGLGDVYYGAGTSDPALHGTPTSDGTTYWFDPIDSSKSYHAYPYQAQVWAYDANDLLAVKNGVIQPWEVKPYKIWKLEGLYDYRLSESGEKLGTGYGIGGVDWDEANNRLYVTQKSVGRFGMPVIHAWELK